MRVYNLSWGGGIIGSFQKRYKSTEKKEKKVCSTGWSLGWLLSRMMLKRNVFIVTVRIEKNFERDGQVLGQDESESGLLSAFTSLAYAVLRFVQNRESKSEPSRRHVYTVEQVSSIIRFRSLWMFAFNEQARVLCIFRLAKSLRSFHFNTNNYKSRFISQSETWLLSSQEFITCWNKKQVFL